MSMKRDRTNNEMVIPFLVNANLSAGMSGKNTSSFYAWTPRSMPNNMLLIMTVADWNASGTIDIRVQDCDTQTGTYTTHKTVAQLTGAAGNVFIAEVHRFKRYVRLNYDSSHACTLSVIGVAARGRREPVTQLSSVTTLAVT